MERIKGENTMEAAHTGVSSKVAGLQASGRAREKHGETEQSQEGRM